MGLSEKLRKRAFDLLNYVPISDLNSLSQTVTRGMITPLNSEECKRAIILHSENARKLLTRKKISKEILFKYLNDNNVYVNPSLEKNNLISQVLQLWECEDETTKGDTHPSRQQSETQCEQSNLGVTETEVNELAEKFSEWFYKLLNDQGKGEEKLIPEHFWKDCSMHLAMISPSNKVTETVHEDAASVVQLLSQTVHQHSLYFNPNLSSSGIQGKLDPHGLVLVFACGTLHQIQKCVGIFEQFFALARDPFSLNNWKIKSTKLILRSEEVNNVPVLKECEMTGMLAITK